VPGDFQARWTRIARGGILRDSGSGEPVCGPLRIQTVKKAETRARKIEQFSGCWSGARRSTPDSLARSIRPLAGAPQAETIHQRAVGQHIIVVAQAGGLSFDARPVPSGR